MSRISRASLIIAIFFGLDKILGLLRAVLFNRTFSTADRDVFFVSNNIPDLLSALISGGALGIALIPVLTEHLQLNGRSAAWHLFSQIINLAFLVTAAIAFIIILLADPLVQHVIAPGFNDPVKWKMTSSLMRLDLLAIMIFSISGLVMAGLQANQHFLFPAMAPALYNIGQIVGILVLAPRFGIYGLAYGVILGALLHLGIQIPGLLIHKFHWSPGIDLRDPGVRQVLSLMGPRLLTMLCLQSYFLVRDRYASFFQEGAISALNNGWFIQQVPETLIGTAIAIALLPSLSEYLTLDERDRFRETVNRALRVMLAFTVPIAVLMAVAIRPLVQIVFGFGPAETELVVWCTRAFLLGLTGHTWLEVAVRSFYAQQDAVRPLIAAFLQAITFTAVAWVLSKLLGPAGIALSDSLTFTAQALFLLFILNRRFPKVLQVKNTLMRALAASALGGILTLALLLWLPLPTLVKTFGSLAVGGMAALPWIWPEVRTLVKL
jgi:putative peptidoglycan lipid II flippase